MNNLNTVEDNNLYKLINLSLQGFNIFLNPPGENNSFWLKPKESVMVHESHVSEQIKRMVKRRILKLERV